MKKLLVLLMALVSMQVALADGAANIKIRINGALHDNRYFLCLPDVGCLSVLAAQRGKIYPMFRTIALNNIYILDTNDHFRLSPQAPAPSCHITVDTGKTVTISGSISKNGQNIRLSQLHCTVR